MNVPAIRFFVTRTFFYDRPNSDPAVEDVGVLRPYGINKLGEHFYVQHLDGGTMILLSDKLRLYFEENVTIRRFVRLCMSVRVQHFAFRGIINRIVWSL